MTVNWVKQMPGHGDEQESLDISIHAISRCPNNNAIRFFWENGIFLCANFG